MKAVKAVKAEGTERERDRRHLSGLVMADVPDILSVDFNQDGTAFSVGLSNGFRTYNTDPLSLLYEQSTPPTPSLPIPPIPPIPSIPPSPLP